MQRDGSGGTAALENGEAGRRGLLGDGGVRRGGARQGTRAASAARLEAAAAAAVMRRGAGGSL